MKKYLLLSLYPNKYNIPEDKHIDNLLSHFYADIKMFLSWCFHPVSILFFIFFIPINFILYWVYLFFFFIHLFCWLYRFTCYIFLNNQSELKPTSYLNDKPRYLLFHFVWIYTFYRAYLNSFACLYKISSFFMRTELYKKKTHINTIWALLKVFLWWIIRVLTSLPRNVILDSYKWSLRFKYPISYYLRSIKSKSLLEQLFMYFVGGILNQDVYRSIFPYTYLRIYSSESTRWNFNPGKKLRFIQNIEKGYSNESVYRAVKSITSDMHQINESCSKLLTLNIVTPSYPSIPHLTTMGKLLYSPNGYKDDLIFSFNQTTKPNIRNLSKTCFSDSAVSPVFTRSNNSITSSEYSLKTPTIALSLNDSRLIYESEKLFRTDFLVYFLVKSSYLNHTINLYSKDGYLVEDHFNEILIKINKNNSLNMFNSLSDVEKDYFSAMLIAEVNYNLVDILDLYEINQAFIIE